MGRPAYSRFVCSCGESCVMVPSASTGKLAPITLATYPDGNIAIDLLSVNGGHGTYRIVSTAEREANPVPRPMSHWATCPDADRFRR